MDKRDRARAAPWNRVILEGEPCSFTTLREGIDVTDGWNARPASPQGVAGFPQGVAGSAQGVAAPRDGVAGQPASPWWSDALADPWRDPYAPAAVVVSAPRGAGGEPEPV